MQHGYRRMDMVEQFDAKSGRYLTISWTQPELRDRMLAVGLPI